MIEHVMIFLTCQSVVFGDPPEPTPPECNQPSLPFTNGDSALQAAEYFHNQCVFIYTSDGYPRGMPGFKQMFGDYGHIFNESTTVYADNVEIKADLRATIIALQGFRQGSKLVTIVEPFTDFELVSWGPYNVSFTYSVKLTMNVGVYEDYTKVMVHSVKYTWFEDASGIRKSQHANTSGMFGYVLRNAASAAAVLGYLDDDYEPKTGTDPIRFIFVCVFSVITSIVAFSVYMFLKCVCGKRETTKAEYHGV